ncbi:hypothetical protein TSUD_325860 [Trifolium subterraneum]|uniref:ELMO domain-containing protein n=1 Tax=Trifolium subterraneum TaxID=3900 RepID=A0A2Z6LI18_TRISU|nr:hypothetical protein TSUD_325860 [Trifolium subterraneum]
MRNSADWLYADDATCGSPHWIGKGLTCVCFKPKGGNCQPICITLTPLQDALRALWSASFPGEELRGLISDQWKEMGWQGRDPSTDFRGAGFISLENLLFFAKTFSTSFQNLLMKQGRKGIVFEYPFAVAAKPRTFIRTVFLQMLSENEWAFDLLYCVAFVVMDKQWLETNATYMQFNDILKSTRVQLERELMIDDVLRIEDMPSYRLLF